MADVKVTTEEFDGRKIDIFVNGDGEFYAVPDPHDIDEVLREATLALLRKKITGYVRRKKARIAIPVVHLKRTSRHRGPDQYLAYTGMITGIHQRNRNVLFTTKAEKGVQQSDYDDDFYRADTDVTTLNRLIKATVDANQALETFKEAHRVNPRQAVREALKAAGVGEADLED